MLYASSNATRGGRLVGMALSSSMQEKAATRNVTKRIGSKIAFIGWIDWLTILFDFCKFINSSFASSTSELQEVELAKLE